jgi:hypothetical protein
MITNKQFNHTMREQKDAIPGLTPEQHSEFFNKYMPLKFEYASLGNDTKDLEKRAEITQVVQKDKSDTDRHIQLQDYISRTTLDQNASGNIFDKLGQETAQLLAGIVDGTIKLESENKVPGYYDDNGNFHSIQEVQDSVDSNKRDEGSAAGIKALVENVERKASQVKEGDSYDFDYQREYNNVLNKVVEKGNLNSLTKDEIFGNRVFEDDLKSTISNETYGSVGVDTGESSPFAKADNIIEDDVNMIAANIMQDPPTHKKYLAEYFTKAMAQNWHHNLPMKIKNIIKNKKETSSTSASSSSVKSKGDIQVNGGVIRNGIFMPNKA